jgi:hypothetical protein
MERGREKREKNRRGNQKEIRIMALKLCTN